MHRSVVTETEYSTLDWGTAELCSAPSATNPIGTLEQTPTEPVKSAVPLKKGAKAGIPGKFTAVCDLG